MHASELCGSSVALAIAEEIIRAHLVGSGPVLDLPAHLGDLLRDDLLVYVLPRMSPDGAERTLDVLVSRLRKKLGDAGMIQTVWGVGYRLAGSAPT